MGNILSHTGLICAKCQSMTALYHIKELSNCCINIILLSIIPKYELDEETVDCLRNSRAQRC